MNARDKNPYGESKIKCALIDYLDRTRKLEVKENDEQIFAVEVPFLDGRRRADLILLSKQTEAFEIKSRNDNLDLLKEQLSDYVKVFQQTSLVVDKKHEFSLKGISSKIGVYIYKDGEIFQKRKPDQYKKIDKKSVYFSMDRIGRRELERAVRSGVPISSMSQPNAFKKMISKVSVGDAIFHHRNCLKNRYRESSLEFIRNRGALTQEEDLRILSRANMSTEIF